MNKCTGCGMPLDNDKDLCERCFRIKNYNEHLIESKYINNNDILTKINERELFTFYLCDLFSLNNETVGYYNEIKNPKMFILTKFDEVPKNINIDKLLNNIKRVYHINKILALSIKNNYGIKDFKDLLLKKEKFIFAGPTSSGKSSLINYLFETGITVSNYKNTTQDFIVNKVDNLEIIDAPGFDIVLNNTSSKAGCIKPVILKLKKDYILEINDYKVYFNKDENITLYLQKGIIFKTYKKKNENFNKVNLNNSDIILNNLGFIYTKAKEVYVNNEVELRESLVGRNE